MNDLRCTKNQNKTINNLPMHYIDCNGSYFTYFAKFVCSKSVKQIGFCERGITFILCSIKTVYINITVLRQFILNVSHYCCVTPISRNKTIAYYGNCECFIHLTIIQ